MTASHSTMLAQAHLPKSEAARDLLSQKLQAVHHRKVTPPSLAKTARTEGSALTVAPALKDPQPAQPAQHSEANPAPSTSMNSGTPLPPLAPLAPPKRMSEDELAELEFVIAQKRIVSPASLERWQRSDAFEEILGFVMSCNDAVVGKKLTETVEESPATKAIVAILNDVAQVIEDVPAEQEGSSRFGNPAFRTFYARVKEQSRKWHETIPGLKELKGKQIFLSSKEETNVANSRQVTDAIGEVETYFIECFGNEKRIDYGSGMELNFACWLLCLVKLGILDLQSQAPAIVLRIFWRYIEVMRSIQSTYWLEPAGSHGVWGLDDYHFLPFLFGSAQLKSHKIFRPKSIHDEEILADFSKDYMYFACIKFINSIKTASLRWHSPMLDDISGVKTWAKVNEGMMKMYKAEVMLKLPIAQHMFFGSIIQLPALNDEQDENEDSLQRAVEQGGVVHTDEHGHTHVHAGGDGATEEGAAQAATGWGDCCGIPIPSAFAAAQQQEREKLRGAGGVRRIPFD